mmetsp:Transcript_5034/g.7426  ORF Transcript_5034/g.7426 Transcript_5034/m.7426 type:complete len:363 (+) Transcript_5034:89-1177(+)
MILLEERLIAPLCYHIHPTKFRALVFCALVAFGFVSSLYIFVPPNVRSLARNDTAQIKWRIIATVMFAVLASTSYPFIFCGTQHIIKNHPQPLHAYLCWSSWKSFTNFIVLCHTMLLFLGPIMSSVLLLPIEAISNGTSHPTMQVRNNCNNNMQLKNKTSVLDLFGNMCILIRDRFKNTFCLNQGWIRDYVAAPFLEEIVFRGLFCSPLLASGFTPTQVVWIAPLFFGVAHIHHALVKLGSIERHLRTSKTIQMIVCSSLLQFIYTFLFGMYSTYAILRTRSILSVTASHMFCNLMGLPDLSFMIPPQTQTQQVASNLSLLYPYRYILLCFYFLGIYLFIKGFSKNGNIFDNQGGLIAFFPS